MKRGENPLVALVHLMGAAAAAMAGVHHPPGRGDDWSGLYRRRLFPAGDADGAVPGESLTLGDYSLRFDNLEMYPGSDGREVLEATTSLFKNGEFVRTLKPRRDFFSQCSGSR